MLQTALMASMCLLSIVAIPSATWQQLAVDPTSLGAGAVKFLRDAAAVCIYGEWDVGLMDVGWKGGVLPGGCPWRVPEAGTTHQHTPP